MARIAKQVLRIVMVFIAAGIMLLIVVVGGLQTKPGKQLLADFLENLANQQINGLLEIGGIRGNFLNHLTLSKIELRDSQGKRVLSIENLLSEHQIESLVPFRFKVKEFRVEQPRFFVSLDRKGNLNLKKILKEKKTSEAKSQETSSQEYLPTFLAVDWINLVEAKILPEKKDPRLPVINDLSFRLNFPRQSWSYPQGTLSLRGDYQSKPLFLVINVGNEKKEDALALSAAAKPGMPVDQTLESVFQRVGAKLSHGRSHFGFDAVVQNTQDTWPIPRTVWLEDFSAIARCELFRLRKRAMLVFHDKEFLPRGEFSLQGCAGTLEFAHERETLELVFSRLSVDEILTALSNQKTATKVGAFSGKLEMGLQKQRANLDLEWLSSVLPEMKTHLKASVEGSRLNAKFDVQAHSERVEGHLEARRIFKPGSWSIDLEKTETKLQVASEGFKLSNLSKLGFTDFRLMGEVKAMLTAEGSLRKTKIELQASGKNVAFLSQSDAQDLKENAQIHFKTKVVYDSKSLGFNLQVQPTQLLSVGSVLEFDGGASLDQALLMRRGFAAIERTPFWWTLFAERFELTRMPIFRRDAMNAENRVFVDLKGYGRGTLAKPHGDLYASILTPQGELMGANLKFAERWIDMHLKSRSGQIDPLFALLGVELRTQGGSLDADFHAKGKPGRMDFSGEVAVAAQSLRIPVVSTTYEDFQLKLKGNDMRVDLEKLQLKSEGLFTANGKLIFGKHYSPERVEIIARMQDFNLLANENLSLKTSGALYASANPRDASFNGSFEVERGVVEVPDRGSNESIEPLNKLEDVVYTNEPQEEKRQDGFFDKIHGSIDVKVPGQVWVRSSEFNVEFGGDLRLGLDDESEFFLQGRAQSLRGYAEFFGRRFEVRKAMAEFLGDPANPRIDAQALYAATPRDVIVELSGPLQTLKPQFYSDPPGYSEEQSLGVLLTGSADYQTQATENPGVGGIATGYLLGQLKGRFGRELPFDLLKADLNATPEDTGVAGTQRRAEVEVGKYVSDRVFLKLRRVFGTDQDEPINEFSLDYRLSRRWSLETTQSDQGVSEFELLWTLNY
ncbi:MAG: translocation/assembly module TamB domain-containing protein [Bdellovibrionota bacterium]